MWAWLTRGRRRYATIPIFLVFVIVPALGGLETSRAKSIRTLARVESIQGVAAALRTRFTSPLKTRVRAKSPKFARSHYR